MVWNTVALGDVTGVAQIIFMTRKNTHNDICDHFYQKKKLPLWRHTEPPLSDAKIFSVLETDSDQLSTLNVALDLFHGFRREGNALMLFHQVLVNVKHLPIFPGAYGTPMELGQASGGWGRPSDRVRAKIYVTCVFEFSSWIEK